MPRPRPHIDHKAAAAARYERTWDAIEAAYALREGTALWWEEGFAEVTNRERARIERERQEEALREHRDRARANGGAAVEDRARGWITSPARDRNSSYGAYKACVGLVKGFALDAGTARVMMSDEFGFYRKWAAGELASMLARAARSNKPLGYLLNEDRRR